MSSFRLAILTLAALGLPNASHGATFALTARNEWIYDQGEGGQAIAYVAGSGSTFEFASLAETPLRTAIRFINVATQGIQYHADQAPPQPGIVYWADKGQLVAGRTYGPAEAFAAVRSSDFGSATAGLGDAVEKLVDFKDGVNLTKEQAKQLETCIDQADLAIRTMTIARAGDFAGLRAVTLELINQRITSPYRNETWRTAIDGCHKLVSWLAPVGLAASVLVRKDNEDQSDALAYGTGGLFLLTGGLKQIFARNKDGVDRAVVAYTDLEFSRTAYDDIRMQEEFVHSRIAKVNGAIAGLRTLHDSTNDLRKASREGTPFNRATFTDYVQAVQSAASTMQTFGVPLDEYYDLLEKTYGRYRDTYARAESGSAIVQDVTAASNEVAQARREYAEFIGAFVHDLPKFLNNLSTFAAAIDPTAK